MTDNITYYSYVPHKFSKIATPQREPWETFVDVVTRQHEGEKDTAPGVVLGRYKGNGRESKDWLGQNIIGLDGDKNADDPEKVHEILKAAGLTHVIYTTSSHGKKGNRWRVFVPVEGVLKKTTLLKRAAKQLHKILTDNGCEVKYANESHARSVWYQSNNPLIWEYEGSKLIPELNGYDIEDKEPESSRGHYTADQVQEMLEGVDPDMGYHDWIQIGIACKALLGARRGIEVWDGWSAGAAIRYEPGACQAHWDSFPTNPEFDPVLKLKDHTPRMDAADEFDDDVADADAEPSGEELQDFSNPVLSDEALPGVLGTIVERARKHSEATKGMVAGTVLSHFSARFGHALTLKIGDIERPLNSYMIGIGPTGKGRKGTSEALPRKIFKEIDALLSDGFKLPRLNVITSFSSGEGLIQILADDDDEFSVKDKRLLAVQSEFSNILSVASREGNTLSEMIRDSYDGTPLQVNTKNSPLRAEDYHLCIMGHITGEEFLKRAEKTDQANGFLNRFLVFGSYRDKLVAIPKATPTKVVQALAEQIVSNLESLFPKGVNVFSRKSVVMRLDDTARREWRRRYHELTMAMGSNTSVTKLMARAELHTLLYAALIAAINGKREVDIESLTAGFAWVEHSTDTLERVFSTTKERTKKKKVKSAEDVLVQILRDHGGTATMAELQDATRQGKNKLTAAARNKVIKGLASGHPPRVKMGSIPRKDGKGGRPVTTITLLDHSYREDQMILDS